MPRSGSSSGDAQADGRLERAGFAGRQARTATVKKVLGRGWVRH